MLRGVSEPKIGKCFGKAMKLDTGKTKHTRTCSERRKLVQTPGIQLKSQTMKLFIIKFRSTKRAML